MGMVKEFKEFAVKGNMIDMAVGIIIGGAFGKIVSSLVQDVIMPPLGILLGGVDFTDLTITLKKASPGVEAVTLKYGAFIQTSVDFIIVAFAIFVLVKAINALKRKEEAAPTIITQPSEEVILLTQIRDTLKNQKNLALALFLSASFLFSSSAFSQDQVDCKSSLLVEPISGEVIYEHNADEALSPASVVKLMNAYVVFKKLKQGLLSKDEIVTASAFASNIGGSQVYLKEKEQFTVGQLLEAMMVQSANDAATALAEHIAGSSEAYVQMMNEEAQSLGMKNSEFHSPHGLPPGKDQKPDLITARDIVLLARTLLQEFPGMLEYSSKTTAPFRDSSFTMFSPNHLLKSFPGADGMKTGYYALAGFSIVATAKRNDIRMLAAVLGCKKRQDRDKEAAKLLAQGLAQYKIVPLIAKGEEIEGAIPVANGTKQTTIAIAKEDFKALVNSKEIGKIKKVPNLCEGLDAPFNAGAPCGTLSFVIGEREIGRVSLVATESIEALSFGGKVARYIGIQ